MTPQELLALDEMSVRNRVLKLLEIERDLTREIRRLHDELDVTPIKRRLAAEIADLESTIPILEQRIADLRDEEDQVAKNLHAEQRVRRVEAEEHAQKRAGYQQELQLVQDHIGDANNMLTELRESITQAHSTLKKFIDWRVSKEEYYDKLFRGKRDELRAMDEQMLEKVAGLKSLERKRRDLERRSRFLDLWEDRLWTREHDVNMLSERVKPLYEKLFPGDKINVGAFQPSHERHEFLHEKN